MNPFQGPYVPANPQPLYGAQPPNVSALLQGIKPLPGNAFLQAAAAKKASAPKTPPAAAITAPAPPPRDPVNALMDLNTGRVAQAQSGYDQAQAKLDAYQPDDGGDPQYQAPAQTQVNPGATIGHLLAGLLAPRLAPAAARGVAYDQAEAKETDARNQKQAELQEQAAQAEANRKAHLSEITLGKLTTDADNKERILETTIGNSNAAVYHAQSAAAATSRADTYAKRVADELTLGQENHQLSEARLHEIANKDAQTFGLKNKEQAFQIWHANLQAYVSASNANQHASTALAIANQNANLHLTLAQITQNGDNLRARMGEKFNADKQALTTLAGQQGRLVAQMAMPGADMDALQAQNVALQSQITTATSKLQADSAGAFQPAQTDIGQGLNDAASEGYAGGDYNVPVPPQQPGSVTNNYYGAGAQPAAGAQIPNPGSAPGAAPGTPAAQLQAFLRPGGGQAPPGGTPPPAAAPAQPHVAAAPPPPQQRAAEAQRVRALIAAHPGDPRNAQAVSMFAARFKLTPQQASQILGVGAAPQGQQPPQQPARPAAPTPGTPPQPPQSGQNAALNAVRGPMGNPAQGQVQTPQAPPAAPKPGIPPAPQPGTPQQRPMAAPKPTENPAQFALRTARQADAQEPNVPVDQKVKTLTAVIQKQYPTLSPQMALQIASNTVQSLQGQPGWARNTVHGVEKAAGAVGGAVKGYLQGQVNDANARDAGGSTAAGNPPAGW